MSKKIIVCTTMRDFKGTDNDLIQIKFLESLQSQTIQSLELVMTLFGEKSVEKNVKGVFPNAVFYEGILGDYRYSLTQVLNNAIDYAETQGYSDYAILWTTCDVLYESEFIEKSINYLKDKAIVTSHPHKIVVLNDSSYDESRLSSPSSGFDMLFFSSEFLQDKKIRQAHNKYVFKDWGVYEHFLISLTELSDHVKMINIYEESSIVKVENDRVLTNEPSEFLINSHKRNQIVFKEYLNNNHLSVNYFNLFFCHLKFKMSKDRLKHYLYFYKDMFIYASYLRRRLVSSFVPSVIKNHLRRK